MFMYIWASDSPNIDMIACLVILNGSVLWLYAVLWHFPVVLFDTAG